MTLCDTEVSNLREIISRDQVVRKRRWPVSRVLSEGTKPSGCPFIYDVDCPTPAAAHPTVERSETPRWLPKKPSRLSGLAPDGVYPADPVT